LQGKSAVGENSSRWLGYDEAAALLGQSVDTVRRRARQGRLKKKLGEDGRAYVLIDDMDEELSNDHQILLRLLQDIPMTKHELGKLGAQLLVIRTLMSEQQRAIAAIEASYARIARILRARDDSSTSGGDDGGLGDAGGEERAPRAAVGAQPSSQA
jgi:hypothetical protein